MGLNRQLQIIDIEYYSNMYNYLSIYQRLSYPCLSSYQSFSCPPCFPYPHLQDQNGHNEGGG